MPVDVKTADLRSDIARALVASLGRARALAAPFPNWRLEGLFPEPVARSLAALPFAPTRLDGISGRRELHNDDRRYFAGEVLDRHPVTREIAAAFQSPQAAEAFALKTGARLDGTYLRVEYGVDVDGFWLEPHTDLGVKALTLLVQLPDQGQSELGTDLYAAPGAWAERCDFAWNGALLFVPSDDTWHGFEPRPIAGVRRSVIVNYVTDEWRAREQLAFPQTPVRLG
jgi:hypothetical protein